MKDLALSSWRLVEVAEALEFLKIGDSLIAMMEVQMALTSLRDSSLSTKTQPFKSLECRSKAKQLFSQVGWLEETTIVLVKVLIKGDVKKFK